MSRTIYGQLHRRFGVRESGASRRDFLKGVAAAGAAMLLSSCAHTEKTKEEMAASQHVIVVGAGFAGLACAYELRMAGYNVTVIDGRDRLGGRVLSFTDFIPRRVIEGGGELIGTNHPLWAAYAGKFRLDLVDISEDESLDAPLVVEGKALSREEAKKLYDEMTTVLATMNDDARKVVADEPWETPDAQELDRRPTTAWLESTNASALCKAAIKAQLEGNNAVPLARQSYLGNLAQVKGGGVEKYWTDTENRHCKQGNQELANQFADGIGRNNILLSTMVDNISVANLSVIVTTSDGLTLDAHDVVLAAPPSTWSKIGFVPMLPAELQPQMGMAVKYLAEVKSRFWEAEKLSAEGQGDGPVSMTWESTKGQGGTKSAGLTAFSGSAAAEECRQVHISRRDAFYAKAIGQMYPGFGEQFVKSRFMDWPSDPLALCSYSFPAPGQITTMGPMLRQGLGRLHFAGEHTCYKFVGYMEGALESGVRVARALAKRDGMNSAAAKKKQTA